MKIKQLAWAAARLVFFAVSLIYLGLYAREVLANNSEAAWLTTSALRSSGVAVLIFASTALFSVLGWRSLLAGLGHPLDRSRVACVFCLTQIAKYLPGNVGHHIGRVALSKIKLDVPVATTVVSLAQESALVILAAATVGTACYGLNPVLNLPEKIIGIDNQHALSAFVAAVAAGLLVVGIVRTQVHHSQHPAFRFALRITPSWQATAASLPGYLVTNIINGLAITTLASAFFPVQPSDVLLLTAAYSFSWLAGFLLPGAPGGLGVREAALVFLLGNNYPDDAVLAMLFLSRGATVLADLLIFLAGTLLRRSRQ